MITSNICMSTVQMVNNFKKLLTSFTIVDIFDTLAKNVYMYPNRSANTKSRNLLYKNDPK